MNPSIQMLGYHLSFFHCLSLASGRTYSEDTCNYIFTDYAMKFVLLCISKLASKLNFSSTAIMLYSCSEIMDWDSGITSSSPGYWDLYCGTREYLPPLYIVEEKYRWCFVTEHLNTLVLLISLMVLYLDHIVTSVLLIGGKVESKGAGSEFGHVRMKFNFPRINGHGGNLAQHYAAKLVVIWPPRAGIQLFEYL